MPVRCRGPLHFLSHAGRDPAACFAFFALALLQTTTTHTNNGEKKAAASVQVWETRQASHCIARIVDRVCRVDPRESVCARLALPRHEGAAAHSKRTCRRNAPAPHAAATATVRSLSFPVTML